MTRLAQFAILSLVTLGLSASALAQAHKTAPKSSGDACTADQSKKAEADAKNLETVQHHDSEAQVEYNKALARKRKAAAALADANAGKAGAPSKEKAEAEDKTSTDAVLEATKVLSKADDDFQKAYALAQHSAKCRQAAK